MESKKKKTLFNVIMVVLILVIAGCGVMAVGNLKGWFDKGTDSVLMTKDVKGVANIERNGVGYGLEKNVPLRDGDTIETKNGTTAELLAGEKNILSLNANTKLLQNQQKKIISDFQLNRERFFRILQILSERQNLPLMKISLLLKRAFFLSVHSLAVALFMFLKMSWNWMGQMEVLLL